MSSSAIELTACGVRGERSHFFGRVELANLNPIGVEHNLNARMQMRAVAQFALYCGGDDCPTLADDESEGVGEPGARKVAERSRVEHERPRRRIRQLTNDQMASCGSFGSSGSSSSSQASNSRPKARAADISSPR